MTLIETLDDELGRFTLAIDGAFLLGKGNTREEAIEDLIETILEYCDLYIAGLISYFASEDEIELIEIFVKYKRDRGKIRQLLDN